MVQISLPTGMGSRPQRDHFEHVTAWRFVAAFVLLHNCAAIMDSDVVVVEGTWREYEGEGKNPAWVTGTDMLTDLGYALTNASACRSPLPMPAFSSSFCVSR